jgi:folate-binding protein YgfZ
MKAALLSDRGVVRVAGETAGQFLNGLVTTDVGAVKPGAPRFAALLAPQGKILFDFIIVQTPEEGGGGFFLDCPRALAANLVERLNFYKLRAKVAIENRSDVLGVLAVWGGTAQTRDGLIYPDPRLAELGSRAIVQPQVAGEAARDLGAELTDEAAYESHRIALGVPRGGSDFSYGDAFPHEADMDQLRGVDFDKGCYVGQEVVSRIEHRARARTRVVPVAYEGFAPEAGLPVLAGEKAVGTMGSASGGRGLALLRLDRVEEALAGGAMLCAGGIALRLVKPGWAQFHFPGDTKAE